MSKDFLIPKQSKECHELLNKYIEDIGENFIRVTKDSKGNLFIMRASFPNLNNFMANNRKKTKFGNKKNVQILDENQKEILGLLKRGNLTGNEIANKYNVSAGSFYVWKSKNKY